jgi:NAD(P)-dependent dehydrogenase (short-subunit alcohol dehydrogenase family)
LPKSEALMRSGRGRLNVSQPQTGVSGGNMNAGGIANANAARALVVGGGSGIGRATAVRLAGRGADVLVAGRRKAPLQSVVDEIRARGTTRAEAFSGDASDAEVAEQMVDRAVEAFGGLDVCVCATGVFEIVPYDQLTSETWRNGVRDTLDPMVYVSAAAVRRMGTGGRIVLISSVNERASEASSAPYSAAKAATSSLVRSMAVDLARRGIQANAVAPGAVATEMAAPFLDALEPGELDRANPLGRAADPDEIANVITYLALDAPDFLIGETIFVDGGQFAWNPL